MLKSCRKIWGSEPSEKDSVVALIVMLALFIALPILGKNAIYKEAPNDEEE